MEDTHTDPEGQPEIEACRQELQLQEDPVENQEEVGGHQGSPKGTLLVELQQEVVVQQGCKLLMEGVEASGNQQVVELLVVVPAAEVVLLIHSVALEEVIEVVTSDVEAEGELPC